MSVTSVTFDPFCPQKGLGQGEDKGNIWRCLKFSLVVLFFSISVKDKRRSHDHPRHFGRCPVQRGPAGGTAPPRSAAMHRAPAILHHVPGNEHSSMQRRDLDSRGPIRGPALKYREEEVCIKKVKGQELMESLCTLGAQWKE